jgi:hypothetical protein
MVTRPPDLRKDAELLAAITMATGRRSLSCTVGTCRGRAVRAARRALAGRAVYGGRVRHRTGVLAPGGLGGWHKPDAYVKLSTDVASDH